MCAVCALSGCVSDAAHVHQNLPVPREWRVASLERNGDADAPWWQQFDDAVLVQLVATALAENRDVRIAAARVEGVLGRFRTTRGAALPQLGITGSRARDRSSRTTGPQQLSPLVDPEFNQFQVQGTLSWEVDLFGRLRSATAAARYDLLASAYARRGVVLSLVSAVASQYVSLRNLDRQLEITRATLSAREEALRVFTARYQRGAISELEWNQSRAEFESVAAGIPALERAVAQQENALSVLLGRNPSNLPRGKPIGALRPPDVPAGLPSTLLTRRPDLLQAEAELAATQMRVTEARLAFFPDISITGAFGYASKALRGFFDRPSLAWSAASNLSAPLFRGGALQGQLLQAKAVREEAVLRYASAVQTAFRETEDALVAAVTLRQQLVFIAREIDALSRAATLARLRYDNGSTGYLDVLDAERNLFSARLNEAQIETDLLQSHIGLYRAMGGGWVIVADRSASGPFAGGLQSGAEPAHR